MELNEAGKDRTLYKSKEDLVHENSCCEGEKIELEGSLIAETTSFVYLRRSMNMRNNMKEDLDKRRRAVWAAFRPLKEATDQLKNPKIRVHLFDSTVFPTLCYVAKTNRAPLRTKNHYPPDQKAFSITRDSSETTGKYQDGLCFKGENNLVYTEYKGNDFWTKTMAYVSWLRTKFFVLGAETSLAMGTEDLIKGGQKVFSMILDAVVGRKLDSLAPLTLGHSVLDIHRKLVWSLVEKQKCALSVTNADFVGVNGFVYNWDGFTTERGTLARLIHSTTFVSHDASGELLDKPYFKYSIVLTALLRKNELYRMASYQVRQLPFNFNEDRMLLKMPADYGFITPRYVVVRIDMCHEACMSFLEDPEEPFRVRAGVQQSAGRSRRRGDLGTSENPIVLCPSPVQPALAGDLSAGRTQSVCRMARRKCPLGAYVEIIENPRPVRSSSVESCNMCRGPIQGMHKDAQFNEVVESFLLTNPTKRRSSSELEALDATEADFIQWQNRGHSRTRRRGTMPQTRSRTSADRAIRTPLVIRVSNIRAHRAPLTNRQRSQQGILEDWFTV
ncbi:unnamed protein product [Angiostrongylus costaricensis]|uniref:ULP_PROTEASE domain-containing protein n=1 Tax=Angiostrongylus costaricensis TaxID=334426 RepID=A0A158PJH0_ANGCS|nr:unnamed protein product [Angiostrongylus costaricensis]